MTLEVKGQGNKYRVVPFSCEVRKRLYRGTQKHTAGQYIFTTQTGTHITAQNYLRDFKELGKRLDITGVRMSTHTCRHTFAVNYLRKGGKSGIPKTHPRP